MSKNQAMESVQEMTPESENTFTITKSKINKLSYLKDKSTSKKLKMLDSLDNRNKILCLFGNSVRYYRRKLGLSQEDFAWKVGLHRTYVGGIERGERNLSIIKIIDIANALRIRPEDLVLDIDIYMGRV